MSNKRNRLRDSFTVVSSTTTKAPNGDLVETVDGSGVVGIRFQARQFVSAGSIHELAKDASVSAMVEQVFRVPLDAG